jgi:hypothetical protein
MTREQYSGLIHEMLETFSDEHGHGRLWISYPMVESLKHCERDISLCFNKCVVPLKNNVHYKELIGKFKDYQNLRKLSWNDWRYLIFINLQKALCLVEGDYRKPAYAEVEKLFDQLVVFENQDLKFIQPYSSVVVLSSFPFFLSCYFGEKQYNKIIEGDFSKPCRFHCLY